MYAAQPSKLQLHCDVFFLDFFFFFITFVNWVCLCYPTIQNRYLIVRLFSPFVWVFWFLSNVYVANIIDGNWIVFL